MDPCGVGFDEEDDRCIVMCVFSAAKARMALAFKRPPF